MPSSDSERDRARKYKSTQSLHELGLDNYPNPEYPEVSRMSRKEEKQSLQNLNNRLASKSLPETTMSSRVALETGEVGRAMYSSLTRRSFV